MQDEFLRLQAVLQKTIVFITHDFDEAIRLADRIAIMRDGRIVQTGTPEELILQPGRRLRRRVHPRRAAGQDPDARGRSCGRPNGAADFAGELAPGGQGRASSRPRSRRAAGRSRWSRTGRVVGVVDRAAVLRVLLGGEGSA